MVEDSDTPLAAAKRGKKTSMWMAIDSVKNKTSDIALSAGNTGALFVIAKLNLEMIEKIDKPALSGLWPNKTGMNIVLDLGANIECNEKNLMEQILSSNTIIGCESMAMVVGLIADKRVISSIPPGGRGCSLPHKSIQHIKEIL